jgi:hypothetical protein
VEEVPAFSSYGSTVSVSLREYNADCTPFLSLVADERGGETRVLPANFSIPGVIPGHGNSACANYTPSSGFTLYRSQPSAPLLLTGN